MSDKPVVVIDKHDMQSSSDSLVSRGECGGSLSPIPGASRQSSQESLSDVGSTAGDDSQRASMEQRDSLGEGMNTNGSAGHGTSTWRRATRQSASYPRYGNAMAKANSRIKLVSVEDNKREASEDELLNVPEPQIRGWLLKKARVAGWKRRWFSLEKDRLVYYKSNEDKNPRGYLDMSTCMRVWATNDITDMPRKYENCGFGLQMLDGIVYFLAVNATARTHWVEVLETARLMFPHHAWKKSLKDAPYFKKNEAVKAEAAAETTAVPEPEKIPHYGGTLFKRVSGGGWKERYFSLNSGYLSWYKCRSDDQPVGLISMRKVTKVFPVGDSDLEIPVRFHGCSFQVQHPTTTLMLLASRPQAMAIWVDMLRRWVVQNAAKAAQAQKEGKKGEEEPKSGDPELAEYDVDIDDDAEEGGADHELRLRTLSSYVPRQVLKRFEKDPHLLAAAEAERMNGAVLFADISGFTALAETLGRKGSKGAEILTTHLNIYFGQLVDVIHKHGGDIIKYAGDALLALWCNGPLWLSTMMASQCALVMQTQTETYKAGSVTLTLHIGISAGRIIGLHIGGVNDRWEYLIGGKALEEMGEAEGSAKTGEVVLHAKAFQLVRQHCTGKPVANGKNCFLLESINNMMPLPAPITYETNGSHETCLRAYVQPAVRDMLATGQAQWLAQLRRMTVVFASLPDLDYDDQEGQLDSLQLCMREMQKVVFGLDGFIRQFIIDDKGSVLVAAFYETEDYAIRGITAALQLVEKLREFNFRCAVGVTTGKVFLGAVGSVDRREFAMVGDTVNLSARLMVAAAKDAKDGAKDGVLCDHATLKAVRMHVSTLSFTPLPPIKVKGKSDPIAIYRPKITPDVVYQPTTAMAHRMIHRDIVGREVEIKTLTERIGQLVTGARKQSMVVLEADAGLGKSRMLENVREMAAAASRPLCTVEVVCDALHNSTPFYGWRGFFGSRVFLLDTLPTAEERKSKIAAALAAVGEIAASASLLSPVLPAELLPPSDARELDGDRVEKTLALLSSLVKLTACGNPMLLIVDDAHLLDPPSWALIQLLFNTVGGPIMLVAATRPVDVMPLEYRELAEAVKCDKLRLTALSPADTARLVCLALGCDDIPDIIATMIHDKGQGNPFYSQMLAMSMRNTGVITFNDGKCELSPNIKDASDIPCTDTVEDVTTSRIDQLPGRTQFVLKVASVIGPIFRFRLLMHVYPIGKEKAQLKDHLGYLEKQDLLVRVQLDGELAYRFTQTIVQEVCYNMLLFEQRRKLHLAIATWYEEYVKDLTPHYQVLGYHWCKAKEYSSGIKFYVKAGEEALRTYANHDAVKFFSLAKRKLPKRTRATNVEPTKIERVQLELSLAEAHIRLGDHPKGRAHCEEALKILDQPLPSSKPNTLKQEKLKSTISRTFTQSMRFLGIGELNEDAGAEASKAYLRLAWLHYSSWEIDQCVNACQKAINCAEVSGKSPEIARAYAALTFACRMTGNEQLAAKYAQRALETSQTVPHPPTWGYVFHITGLAAVTNGDWRAVKANLDHSLEVFGQLSDWRRWCEVAQLFTLINHHQGKYRESLRLGVTLLRCARMHDDTEAQLWGMIAQCRANLMLGVIPEATRLIEDAADLIGRLKSRVSASLHLEVGALGALVALCNKDVPKACRLCDSIMRLEPSPHVYHLFFAFSTMVEVCLELQSPRWDVKPMVKRDSYRDMAQKTVKILSKAAKIYPLLFPLAQLRLGQVEAAAGNGKKAVGIFEEGLTQARALNVPHETACLLLELGYLTQNMKEKTSMLSEAVTILEKIEAATPPKPNLS